MIGIFGDSFCIASTNLAWPSWPAILRIDNSSENHAASGTSLWYSFEKFLANYHKYDSIVFGYTSAHRIHVLPPELARWSFLRDYRSEMKIPVDVVRTLEPVWKAASLQWNENFDFYIYQHIFTDVNSICQKNNIKLINLLPFEGYPTQPYLIDLANASGPCITEVAHVSDIGLNISSWPCHLSEHNNEQLATLIQELLLNDNTDIIPITNNTKFIKDYHEI